MSDFLNTLEQFKNAADEAAVVRIFEESASKLGLTHLMAGIWSDAEAAVGVGEVLAHTYSDEWMQEYANGLVDCDPILKHAAQSSMPFSWDQCPVETSEEKKFIGLANEIEGMRYGVSASIHVGPGKTAAVSLSSDHDCDITDNVAEIYGLACAFHSAIQAHRAARARDEIRLTPREREVLSWQSRGKTYWEIGEILGTSEDTIRRQTQSAYRKLGAHNSTLAITKAITLNLISP